MPADLDLSELLVAPLPPGDGAQRARRTVARRRRRRRWAATMAVLFSGAAGWAVTADLGTVDSRRVAAGPTIGLRTASLLATPAPGWEEGQPRRLVITEVDSGTSHETNLPELPSGKVALPMLARGDSLVAVVGPPRHPYGSGAVRALAVPAGLGAPWRDLGPANRVLASVDAGRVWLVGDATVQEVDLHGVATTPAYPLPEGRELVAAAQGGLLSTQVRGRLGSLELRDPATAALVHDFGAGATFRASAGRRVLTTERCAVVCPLVVTDVVSRARIELAPPGGTHWRQQASLAPDGGIVAAIAWTAPRDARHEAADLPPGYPQGPVTAARLVLYDTATGRTVKSRSIRSLDRGAAPRWSSDGRWLFVATGPGTVTLYSATSSTVPERELYVGDARSFVVVGSG